MKQLKELFDRILNDDAKLFSTMMLMIVIILSIYYIGFKVNGLI